MIAYRPTRLLAHTCRWLGWGAALLGACTRPEAPARDATEISSTVATPTPAPDSARPSIVRDRSSEVVPNPQFSTLDEEWAYLARHDVPGFAGLLAEGCNLVILLRDLRYEAAARRYWEPRMGKIILGADPASCVPPKAVVRQVRYDFAQLYDWYQRIGPVTAVPGVVSTDIDERRNRIVIGMSGAPSRWLARRLAAGTSIPHGVVQIEAEEFGCSGGALSAVNVTVEDARSRRRLVGVPVTLVVREGAYADTMRGDLGIVYAASERPGTYHIMVSAPGYQTWTTHGVKVTQGRCGLEPTRLRARLKPER